LQAAGWSAEARWEVRNAAAAYQNRKGWEEVILGGLASGEYGLFYDSWVVAKAVGVDPWPSVFERQKSRKDDSWYFVMHTSDRFQIEQAVDLAAAQLDIARICSGPENHLGLGPEFRDENAVDFVVQGLRGHPGVGWPIVKAALTGRTIRLRNMAINALASWGEESWPPDAKTALHDARDGEPQEEVRARMTRLLSGEPLDDLPPL
jgi:hypothetical protein